jgi:hypothetical protein
VHWYCLHIGRGGMLICPGTFFDAANVTQVHWSTRPPRGARASKQASKQASKVGNICNICILGGGFRVLAYRLESIPGHPRLMDG